MFNISSINTSTEQKTLSDWIKIITNLPGGSDSKESACNAGDLGSVPGLGRSLGERNSNPLQYSCLENPHGQRNLAGLQYMGSQRVRHRLSN